MSEEVALLALEAETIFRFSDNGRILGTTEPGADPAPAPRLHWAGCESGSIVRLRNDLRDETVGAITEALNGVLLLPAGSSLLEICVSLLEAEAPVQDIDRGLLWTIPPDVSYVHGVSLVTSDTPGGQVLVSGFLAHGLPNHLVEAGFVSVNDLWEPWCMAIVDGEIASIAFAARLATKSAEVGVYTFPAFRGKGYAAAVTSGWASLPSLRERTLFYGTSETNSSSQRVAQRLSLPMLGRNVSIT